MYLAGKHLRSASYQSRGSAYLDVFFIQPLCMLRFTNPFSQGLERRKVQSQDSQTAANDPGARHTFQFILSVRLFPVALCGESPPQDLFWIPRTAVERPSPKSGNLYFRNDGKMVLGI